MKGIFKLQRVDDLVTFYSTECGEEEQKKYFKKFDYYFLYIYCIVAVSIRKCAYV